MKAKKVLLAQNIDISGIIYLKNKGYEIVESPDEDHETIKELISDCSAVISKTLFIDEDLMKSAPDLKVVGKHGAGVDNVVNVADASRNSIFVVRTPYANSVAVAEHTFSLILALAKNLTIMNNAVRVNDFMITDRISANDLYGKTLGLVGYGMIGKNVAQRALAFGMNVMVYDPFIKKDNGSDSVTFADSLMTVASEADYLSLHLPGTASTSHIINEEVLKSMKPTAFLVNCARGSVVDTTALVKALDNKWISGAALDVYEEEPFLSDSPLKKMDNVILTPHSAALSHGALKRMSEDVALGVHEILSGKTPTWCVNYDEVNGRKE